MTTPSLRLDFISELTEEAQRKDLKILFVRNSINLSYLKMLLLYLLRLKNAKLIKPESNKLNLANFMRAKALGVTFVEMDV